MFTVLLLGTCPVYVVIKQTVALCLQLDLPKEPESLVLANQEGTILKWHILLLLFATPESGRPLLRDLWKATN